MPKGSVRVSCIIRCEIIVKMVGIFLPERGPGTGSGWIQVEGDKLGQH